MPVTQCFRLFTWLTLALTATALSCADDDAGRFEAGPDIAQARVAPGTSLTLSTTSRMLSVGEAFEATATLTLPDGATVDVSRSASWSSDDTGVAWVQKGEIIAVAPGITLVTASYADKDASVKVMVTTDGLRGIELKPSTLVLPVGRSVRLSAVGVFAGDIRRDVTSLVHLRSSDQAVAATEDDSVVATGVGTATIEATLHDVSSSIELSVTDAALNELSVVAPHERMPVGTSQQLQARGHFSDGLSADLSGIVEWASDDSNLATVDEAGVLEARNSGRVRISARLLGEVATATVSVTAAVLRVISVTPSGASLGRGAHKQMHATGRYSDDTTLDITAKATWRSSDSSALTVGDQGPSKGVATGLRLGTVAVTAALDGVSGSTPVVVTAPQLVAIAVSPTEASVVDGAVRDFTATGHYTDGSSQDLTATVSWRTTDAVIAAASDGEPGVIQSRQSGETTVVAALDGIEGTAELTVTEHEPVRLEIDGDISLPRGASRMLQATAIYSDGERGDVTSQAHWHSDDTRIATVNSRGQVSAVHQGEASVGAELSGITGNVTVTVTDPLPTALEINAPTDPIIAGYLYTLRATVTYGDGSEQDAATGVAWSSSAPEVATVTDTGILMATAPGTTTVGVTVADMSAQLVIHVSPLP